MNKSLFVLFLVVVASCLLSAKAAVNNTREEESHKCDFSCWLSKLDVGPIEDTFSFYNVEVEFLGTFVMSGSIRNLHANNIKLGNIVSKTPSPYSTDPSAPSIYLQVTLGVHAEGDWESIGPGKWNRISVGEAAGYADFQIDKVVVGLTMMFEKNKTDGLISRARGKMMCSKTDDRDFQLEIPKGGMIMTFERTTSLMSIVPKNVLAYMVENLGPSLLPSLLPTIRATLCPIVENMVNENLTEALGLAKNLIYDFWNNTDPINIPVAEETMVDLHASPLIDTARFLFEKFVGVNGPFNLSYIVDIFSKGKGVLRLKDLYEDELEFTIPVDALNASLTLGIDDVVVEGLQTWNEFNILEPVNYSNVLLYTHTNLSYLAISLNWHIIVELKDEDAMMYAGGETLREDASFYVSLNNNIMDFYLQLASFDNLAQNYSNRMCMNTSCMEALLSSNSTGITYFTLHMEFDTISLTADKGDLEEDVRTLINNIASMFVDNYKFAIPPFVNGIVMSFLPKLNDLISGFLAEAYCENDPDPEFIEVDVAVTAGSVGGASVLTALLMLLPCSGLLKKKRVPDEDEADKANLEMSDLGVSYVEGANAAAAKKVKSKDDKYLFKNVKCGNSKLREFLRIDEKGASLFFDPRLSLATRVIIPLLLFCTIAIFLSANTGVGASVFVVMTLGASRDVTLPSLFDFGLINSIVDMWTAGVYPLSILVAFFSGIWPYLKVVLMILCWFLPKKIFSEKSRGTMLEWLDILGKWSLLDTYVMIMMLVAFHFNIQFPIVNTQDITKPTAIQIFVYPAYGFLALIIGTLVSLVMSHVLLGLHRYVQPDDHLNDCDDAKRWRPMFLYAANGKDAPVRWTTRILLTAGLVVSMVMMILGTVLNTFSFDFVGLVGWLLPMLGIDSKRAYSVLSLTEEVPPSAQEPNSFTVRFTQVVFIMTAFVIPLMHITAMLVLWLAPLKRKVQHYLNYACEVLSAWSCVDVFIISIIAACLEIQQFAGFMVGDKCDFLIPYLNEYFADFVGDYLSCFEVIATLESGCYVLFIGTIIYTAVYLTFNSVVAAGLRTRGNNGMPMTKEQVKDLEDRGKNKKKKDKAAKDVQFTGEGQGQAFGDVNQSNAFVGGISTSNKSFVASVSTLTIATTHNDGSYREEVEEDEASDSSVEDLEGPGGEAPLPPAFVEDC